MKIKCSYKEILKITDPRIIPNPDNPNDHPKSQIDQFAKILNYQGQRKPIIISNQSGFIVTGHGTLLAAKEAGADEIAVDFQDFDSLAQEYAHVSADNALQLQSEIDTSKVLEKIVDFGDNFDIEMLGFDDLNVDILEDLGTPEVIGEKSIDLRYEMEYIVFVFSDKEKFKKACEKYKIDRVILNKSASYNEAFENGGLGRIQLGDKLL